MTIEKAELDQMQSSYKAAVDEWVAPRGGVTLVNFEDGPAIALSFVSDVP